MRPRTRWTLAAAGLAALGLLASPRGAGTLADGCSDAGLVHYGLSETGKLSVNGANVASYDCDYEFDVDIDDDWWIIVVPGVGIYVDGIEIDLDDPEDLWSSLVVEGPHRYALRRDGKLKKDDAKHLALPWNGSGIWIDLAVSEGTTFAVRTDGKFAVDDDVVATYPTDGSPFRRIVHDGEHSYALRRDGMVFRDADEAPRIRFLAGDGAGGADDGESVATTWIALARDPAGRWLYALRTDGKVYRANIDSTAQTPQEAQLVASLPFDAALLPLRGQLYADLAFDGAGLWRAVTGDGRVYSDDDHLVPEADLPGVTSENGSFYVLVTTFGEHWYCVRTDGRVYQDGNPEEILDLQGEGYGAFAVTDVPPALDEDSTKPPKPTAMTAKPVLGTPLRIPVALADQDTCLDDLVVTPLEPLPPGAAWDAESLSFVWDAPGPAGTHKFKFETSDGIHVTKTVWTFEVKDPDADPKENKPPTVPAFESAVAVVGAPYSLAIVVDDRDGDVVQVTVDPAKYPFTAGAVFDEATRTFAWTPAFEDEGAVDVKFTVTDGLEKKTVVLSLSVKASVAY